MLKCRGVALTDEVNRYNERVSPKAIVENYFRISSKKTPFTMNHDRTKPIGWAYLEGIFIEPGKMYQTVKTVVADTPTEKEELRKEYLGFIKQDYLEENKEEIDKLCEKLGSLVIGNYELGLTNAASIINKGIVLRVFPELKDLLLKKGLFDLNLFEMVMPGIYKRGDFLLFASPYLRRNLSRLNTFPEALLEKFDKLRKKNINVEIALDMDMIGLAGTEQKFAEYEYWWGPHFSEDLESIPEGITLHKNDKETIEVTNVDFTEFGWYTHDNKKVFESEEVVANPNIDIGTDDEKYGCRYTHSILNPKTKLPYHLDGAIRAYTLDEYVKRIDVPLNKASRNTNYTKLWRIDNDIPVKLWKELINDFYRDNILIGEYLGGTDPKIEEIKKEKRKRDSVNNLLPINMKENDGIRIYYEFIPEPHIKGKNDITIFSPYKISLNNDIFNCIEDDTVILIEKIKELNVSIEVENYIKIVHEDLIYNYPTFICNKRENAEKVQEALLNLIEIWIQYNDNRLVSYSIEYPLNKNKWIKLSMAGHIKDHLKILSFTKIGLPQEINFNKWILEIYEYISKSFSNNINFEVSNFLNKCGDLYFARETDDFEISIN